MGGFNMYTGTQAWTKALIDWAAPGQLPEPFRPGGVR